ncbi:hypothetical protein [Pseudoalteromonas sp. HF66]|uniref:hypothetical protein n=1 Tax=Pseudoalteromonas sp. HF66 TaxID=2721559 RepID=UPI001430FDD8|nr:hypothetical protein [Pseudoalteromonas sp. HF66]NIZ06423.1 hypothetical protein [Pseudoalteromonas sp. HF66]
MKTNKFKKLKQSSKSEAVNLKAELFETVVGGHGDNCQKTCARSCYLTCEVTESKLIP